MPMHDWTKVESGIFHAFHHRWISALSDTLNGGKLPADYYALPEVLAVAQVHQIIDACTTSRMAVYFWTVDLLGLRLEEGLNLHVGDIHSARMMVHRAPTEGSSRGKGAKDRYIPLPQSPRSLDRPQVAGNRASRLVRSVAGHRRLARIVHEFAYRGRNRRGQTGYICLAQNTAQTQRVRTTPRREERKARNLCTAKEHRLSVYMCSIP